MRRLMLFHPFLFLLISLLSVYTGARLIASPLQMVRPLLVLWLVLALLYPICVYLARGRDWGGILLSVFVFGFCFTRTTFARLGTLVVIAVIVALLVLWLLKKKIRIGQISAILTITGATISISQVISLLVVLRTIPFSYYRDMEQRSDGLAIPLSQSVQEKPDIYYIVLDGYPRADVLKEIYGFDNSAWVDELKESGFIIPENSHTNYSRTAISVSTTLDMQYWDSITPNMQDAVYWWLVEPVMDRNRLRASLDAVGYQYVAIATDWGITNNPSADLYLKPYPIVLGDYENYFLSATPLRLLYQPFQQSAPIVNDEVHRAYVRYNLETLKTLPAMAGPKFVFSHIIVPHPPFVFDANGDPIDSGASFTFDSPDSSVFSKAEYKIRYVDQVEFINDQMRQVLRVLVEDSSTPPIIIIQADHGSALYVDFEDPQGSCMKERFSNFAAYYLPGKFADIIPPDISAVNIFRIVLNEYFGANLELLEDRQYFMNGYYLFALQDVTSRVNDACVIHD